MQEQLELEQTAIDVAEDLSNLPIDDILDLIYEYKDSSLAQALKELYQPPN